MYSSPPLPEGFLEDIQSLVSQGARTLIDIGCYDGFQANIIRWCGLDVTGLDVRERDLEPPLHFIRGDARLIDQFGRYDIAFCNNLIYHLEDPIDFLRRLKLITSVVYLGTAVTNKPTGNLEGYGGLWMPQESGDFWGTEGMSTFMFSQEGFDSAMNDLGYIEKKDFDCQKTVSGTHSWLLRRYDASGV